MNNSMEEWKEYKLGEITIMKNGKKRPQGVGCYPVYGGNGIMDYTDCFNSERSIIVGRVGAYCGCVYKCDEKCWVSDNAISVSATELVDFQFLYYLMSTIDFHHHHIGGAQPLMTQDIIGDFEVKLPKLAAQKDIAIILSSLDDKIELNRRINRNLEEQAQALFKSWFVDFEPFKDGEFVDSELGMIPKGWRVGTLGDIIEISKKTVNPGKFKEILFTHYSIPAYDDNKQPEKQLGKDILSNKFIVRNQMTLFSKLNPRIKRIWYLNNILDNSICSTEFVPYMSKDIALSTFVYSLISSQGFYDFAMSLVNGATGSHQRFHPEDTLSYPIVYNKETALRYSEMVNPMILQIQKNQQESSRLASLRDTLLPRLMSGALKV